MPNKTKTLQPKLIPDKTDVLSVLGKTAKPSGTKSKAYKHTDSSLTANLKRWIELKEQSTTIKGEMAVVEQDVLDKTSQVIEKAVISREQQTIDLNDLVRLSVTERFSGAESCPPEYEDRLKQVRTIALKPEIADNDEMVKQIIEKLGVDFFVSVFDSKIIWKPKNLKDYFALPESMQQAVKLAKPSFRKIARPD